MARAARHDEHHAGEWRALLLRRALQRLNLFSLQYTMSGDSTLESIRWACRDIVKQEADDYFVIALSGAWPNARATGCCR
jgi:hypothetical protein